MNRRAAVLCVDDYRGAVFLCDQIHRTDKALFEQSLILDMVAFCRCHHPMYTDRSLTVANGNIGYPTAPTERIWESHREGQFHGNDLFREGILHVRQARWRACRGRKAPSSRKLPYLRALWQPPTPPPTRERLPDVPSPVGERTTVVPHHHVKII